MVSGTRLKDTASPCKATTLLAIAEMPSTIDRSSGVSSSIAHQALPRPARRQNNRHVVLLRPREGYSHTRESGMDSITDV
jgi:hypothetical protein